MPQSVGLPPSSSRSAYLVVSHIPSYFPGKLSRQFSRARQLPSRAPASVRAVFVCCRVLPHTACVVPAPVTPALRLADRVEAPHLPTAWAVPAPVTPALRLVDRVGAAHDASRGLIAWSTRRGRIASVLTWCGMITSVHTPMHSPRPALAPVTPALRLADRVRAGRELGEGLLCGCPAPVTPTLRLVDRVEHPNV